MGASRVCSRSLTIVLLQQSHLVTACDPFCRGDPRDCSYGG